MRSSSVMLATLVLCICHTPGQTTTNAPVPTNGPPPAIKDDAKQWSFSATVMGYLVPDSRDYAQPTITGDHGRMHLEARYNYEDLETGSAWVGYNFNGGMLGGVFGDTTGIAPGYKGSLSWWKLELYSEGEYVVDTGDSSGSFFYNWSELTLAPVNWLRLGMVTQRTRAYKTDREIQRGFLVGLSYRKASFTTYVFNPDQSKLMTVLAAGVEF
jgi:hypothetical protein